MSNRPVIHTPDLRPEQLAQAARACPALAAAQKLAEWVGAGRPVTARGVLKPAAAVQACDLLGIEVPTRRPRSAVDIDELMMVWTAASAAGFIQVTGGRVTAGPALGSWFDGPAEAVLSIWSECALKSLGLWGELDPEDLDHLAALATLHGDGGKTSLARLGAGIAELVSDASPGCPCPNCVAPATYPDEAFGLAGDSDIEIDIEEIDAEGTVRTLGEFGIAVTRGDTAELTPLGHWLTDVIFRGNAPSSEVDAATLVGELAPLPTMVAALMARPWLAARTHVAAAAELLTVGESSSGQERLTALALARECGPQAAPAWKEWAAKDGFGAYARLWVAEQDNTEAADVDAAWITVDTLVTVLDALPPEVPADLLATLIQTQTVDEISEVLPLLAGCGHPAAPRLVELLSNGRAESSGEQRDQSGAGYQIKVRLRGVTKPPVWRRLHVPADLRLDRLHAVIQAAMGWDDGHMHVFSDGRKNYGLPDRELGHLDERNMRLSQLLTRAGNTIHYTYDFGDDWEHEIVLEKVLPTGTVVTGPVCTAGKGACPPEDCGGMWGYENLKATLADPGAEEHQDMLDWLGLPSGDAFDPKEFSVEQVNRRLGRST